MTDKFHRFRHLHVEKVDVEHDRLRLGINRRFYKR